MNEDQSAEVTFPSAVHGFHVYCVYSLGIMVSAEAENRFAVAVLRHKGATANVQIDICFFGRSISRCQNDLTNPNDPTRELIYLRRTTFKIIILDRSDN